MAILILGLALFLGVHSIRIVAPAWRDAHVARMGNAWKGIYSVVSIAGFVVTIWGYGLARYAPVLLYDPSAWLKHANAVFTLAAFILLTAAYIPRNHLKAKLGHPMYAGVKVWAFGHLLATGMLHDVVLFGAFLAWSIAGFTVSRRRDRAAGRTYPAGTAMGDILTVIVGTAAWLVFAVWLHPRWIGVPAFG
jgi:uncharacterized membrane protein